MAGSEARARGLKAQAPAPNRKPRRVKNNGLVSMGNNMVRGRGCENPTGAETEICSLFGAGD